MFTYNQLILPSHTEKNTRFLALAGFSTSGPVGVPFLLREGTDPIDVLGQSRLTENVRMAQRYGITPLILRLNGSHGECLIKHEESGADILLFKTIDATDEANNITIHLFPTHLVVEGIWSSQSYLFADYNSLDELVAAIKRELYYGESEVDVEVLNQLPLAGLALNERHVTFNGADDGFNHISNHDDSDTAEKVELQLELLRNMLLEEEGNQTMYGGELGSFLIDTLLFTDIPFEKAPTALTEIFGTFGKSKTDEQKIFCSIVLGSDSFSEDRFDEEGEDMYLAQIDRLLAAGTEARNLAHLTRNLEVVIGSQEPSNGRYTSMPCAATYACMRYKLPGFHHSGTNKPLLYVNTLLSKELRKDEVANLSGSGYICIVPSIKKGFVPFSAKNISPYHTLHSKPHYLRNIHYDVNRIAGFFNQYIGEPVSNAVLGTILSQVTNFVNDLKVNHPIYNDISIEVLDYDQTTLYVAVSFVLYGEVERVSTAFEYVSASEVSVQW